MFSILVGWETSHEERTSITMSAYRLRAKKAIALGHAMTTCKEVSN